jgi:hypothetical protein
VCKKIPAGKEPTGVTKVYILQVQKGPFYFQESLIDPVSADENKTKRKY